MAAHSKSLPLLGLAIIAGALYTLHRWVKIGISRKAFAKEHGCQPPASVFPSKDPFGWTLILEILSANSP